MIKRILTLLGTLVLGGLTTVVIVLIVLVNSKPDLELWHQVELDQEFTADSEIHSFTEYMALEERLFAQLESQVFDRVADQDKRFANRYYRESPSYPGRWATDWNRSYELPVDVPVAGVLLLHGLTDAPYSLADQGKLLHDAGAWVVGLRIPGHGTTPSALTDIRWEDMAAAVQLAMNHLREKVGDRPIIIVGYSNGGALALQYTLTALDESTLPMAQKIVLISPAIGISPYAGLSKWLERLGGWLGLEKLRWESVHVEFNPFKYKSFAINAAALSHDLTVEIARLFDDLGERGLLARFPPVLAFQSAVDATVSTPALITGLMDKLPENGNELVVFDINRQANVEYLLKSDPREQLSPLVSLGELPFTLNIVTNRNDTSADLGIRRYRPREQEFSLTPLGVRWPDDVFSLSHVALPFAADDPLYGRGDRVYEHVQIGVAAYRGERDVLAISATDMLRLKWNPFREWQDRYMLEFIGLE